MNAIAPSARTRTTETVFADRGHQGAGLYRHGARRTFTWWCVAGLGLVPHRHRARFEVEQRQIRVAEGPAHGPQIDKGALGSGFELGPVVSDLLSQGAPRGAGLRSLEFACGGRILCGR